MANKMLKLEASQEDKKSLLRFVLIHDEERRRVGRGFGDI